jgi:hypothetical protein
MGSQHSFITENDIEVLAKCEITRLLPVLIRFKGCRLTTAVQDCAHVIQALEAQRDFCRDVSIPVSGVEAWKKASQL